MIALTFLLMSAVLAAEALTDGPTGKPSSATSYAVYHRKFEPKDGPSKSVHYSTKITPKFSTSTYSKDVPSTLNLNKGSTYSKDNFADGPPPTLSERSPNSKLSSTYSDEGSNYQKSNSEASEYSNGPSNSESNGSNNYSGEDRNYNEGTNYDAPVSPAPVTQYTNEGTNYSPPSYPSETPVFHDAPSYVPPPSDVAYNPGPPSYIPPVQVPSYDNSGFIPSPSFNPGYHQYPVNTHQFPSQFNTGSHSHFPINIPKASFPIPSLPSGGQFSYQPNQFNFNPIASGGHHHHFSSPIKGFPQVPYQQPLLLGSSRVPVVYKPSYNLQGVSNSPSNFHSQYR